MRVAAGSGAEAPVGQAPEPKEPLRPGGLAGPAVAEAPDGPAGRPHRWFRHGVHRPGGAVDRRVDPGLRLPVLALRDRQGGQAETGVLQGRDGGQENPGDRYHDAQRRGFVGPGEQAERDGDPGREHQGLAHLEAAGGAVGAHGAALDPRPVAPVPLPGVGVAVEDPGFPPQGQQVHQHPEASHRLLEEERLEALVAADQRGAGGGVDQHGGQEDGEHPDSSHETDRRRTRENADPGGQHSRSRRRWSPVRYRFVVVVAEPRGGPSTNHRR